MVSPWYFLLLCCMFNVKCEECRSGFFIFFLETVMKTLVTIARPLLPAPHNNLSSGAPLLQVHDPLLQVHDNIMKLQTRSLHLQSPTESPAYSDPSFFEHSASCCSKGRIKPTHRVQRTIIQMQLKTIGCNITVSK